MKRPKNVLMRFMKIFLLKNFLDGVLKNRGGALLPFCQARFKLDLCIDQDALIHPADQTKRGAEASFLSST